MLKIKLYKLMKLMMYFKNVSNLLQLRIFFSKRNVDILKIFENFMFINFSDYSRFL